MKKTNFSRFMIFRLSSSPSRSFVFPFFHVFYELQIERYVPTIHKCSNTNNYAIGKSEEKAEVSSSTIVLMAESLTILSSSSMSGSNIDPTTVVGDAIGPQKLDNIA